MPAVSRHDVEQTVGNVKFTVARPS